MYVFIFPPFVLQFTVISHQLFRISGGQIALVLKGGAKSSFPIFLVCQKKNFLAKGGAMAQAKYDCFTHSES